MIGVLVVISMAALAYALITLPLGDSDMWRIETDFAQIVRFVMVGGGWTLALIVSPFIPTAIGTLLSMFFK